MPRPSPQRPSSSSAKINNLANDRHDSGTVSSVRDDRLCPRPGRHRHPSHGYEMTSISTWFRLQRFFVLDSATILILQYSTITWTNRIMPTTSSGYALSHSQRLPLHPLNCNGIQTMGIQGDQLQRSLGTMWSCIISSILTRSLQ